MSHICMKQYLFEATIARILMRPYGKPTSNVPVSVLVKRLANPYLERLFWKYWLFLLIILVYQSISIELVLDIST